MGRFDLLFSFSVGAGIVMVSFWVFSPPSRGFPDTAAQSKEAAALVDKRLAAIEKQAEEVSKFVSVMAANHNRLVDGVRALDGFVKAASDESRRSMIIIDKAMREVYGDGWTNITERIASGKPPPPENAEKPEKGGGAK